jgi:hypothetical protein
MSNSMTESSHDETVALSKRKKRHRRERVRGAWISFIGRIVAQFVGSAASILLALVLVGKYRPADAVAKGGTAAPSAAVHASAIPQPAPGSNQAVPLVVVVPIDGFSPDGRRALSAAISAALERGDFSATSSPRPAAPLRGARRTARETKGDAEVRFLLARSLEDTPDVRK